MRASHIATVLFLSMAILSATPHPGWGAPKEQILSPRPTSRPTVAYAGTSLECGNKTYHVTTGTKAGRCDAIMTPDGRTKIGVACRDSQGNYGGATCTEGCLGSRGAGDCTKQ